MANFDKNNGKIENMETTFGSHSLSREERILRSQRLAREELAAKLDHILYTEWDPIGVQFLAEFDCQDEYREYLPKLVDLVLAGAPYSELSDQLMVFEGYMKGDESNRRRCDVMAVLLSRYGPHWSNNPFIPNVNVNTSEHALHSVLNLVTQTRLDAYEKKWRAVIDGYEKAIEICRSHLPEKLALVGACLNNVGHAFTALGQLEDARKHIGVALTNFEAALLTFESDSLLVEQQYLQCFNNLIVNLEHRCEVVAAATHLQTLISYFEVNDGRDGERTQDARERLEALSMKDQVLVPLVCERMPVGQDGGGKIGQLIFIE